MFHSVPGVPCAKMERFAGVNLRKCADSFFNLYNPYNLLQPLQPNKNPPFFHLKNFVYEVNFLQFCPNQSKQ